MKIVTVSKFLAVTVALLGGLAALAAEPGDSGSDKPTLSTPIGMAAEVGGGVIGFTTTSATGITKVGGSWTARFVLGTRTHLAGEAAYLGSSQQMSTLGLADSALLLSNGVEGNLRLNLFTGAVQPYAVAGVAWRHYSIANSSYNTSDVSNSDDVAEIPLGVGVSYRTKGFIGDLRGSYRAAFNSNLLPGTNLSAWNVGARIGFEF